MLRTASSGQARSVEGKRGEIGGQTELYAVRRANKINRVITKKIISE